MARTNGSAVKAILSGNYGPQAEGCAPPSLTPYIDAAFAFTTRVATCATAKGITLTSVELELIERWLAAHYYTVSDPLYTSKSTADASASFEKRSYLDVAKQLDASGCVAALIERKSVGGAWLGKPPSAQIPVYQRD